MPAEGRENPLLKKGNSDAFFREKYLTKNRLMILFYVWGFRTREIGELLHWKEATVKARLQRGREKIKKSFFPLVV